MKFSFFLFFQFASYGETILICHHLAESKYTKGLNTSRMVEEDVTLGACNLDGKRIMDDGAIGSAPEGAKSDAKRGKIGRSVLLSIAWRILTIGKDGKSADRPLNDVVREINFITGQ